MSGETTLTLVLGVPSLAIAAGAFWVAWRANTIAKGEPLLALAQEIRTELRQELLSVRDHCDAMHGAISQGDAFHKNMVVKFDEAVRVVRVHQEVYLGGEAEERLRSVGDHLAATRSALALGMMYEVRSNGSRISRAQATDPGSLAQQAVEKAKRADEQAAEARLVFLESAAAALPVLDEELVRLKNEDRARAEKNTRWFKGRR